MIALELGWHQQHTHTHMVARVLCKAVDRGMDLRCLRYKAVIILNWLRLPLYAVLSFSFWPFLAAVAGYGLNVFFIASILAL